MLASPYEETRSEFVIAYHRQEGIRIAPVPSIWKVRTWIYLHLTAVITCAVLSLAHYHRLPSKSISEAVENIGMLLVWPAIACLFLCPLAVLFNVCRCPYSRRWAAQALLAEVILTVAQIFVLLPAVQ